MIFLEMADDLWEQLTAKAIGGDLSSMVAIYTRQTDVVLAVPGLTHVHGRRLLEASSS